jgi:hypothetical protein
MMRAPRPSICPGTDLEVPLILPLDVSEVGRQSIQDPAGDQHDDQSPHHSLSDHRDDTEI